ncbi:hypothetical protein OE88DRAFT_1721588 [Heliocybe sulcata]|uniref:F-box domain-containing protein n=1 Tax=Heliocybe sulcata TaxID=5364 RepID=A0A5C3NF13_9AGAM|nr:hypothetical protein OE88DRAFT_1721588 [Heliocybe sulcata]
MVLQNIRDEIERLSNIDIEPQQRPKLLRASKSAREAHAHALYLHNSRALPNRLPPEILGEILRAFRGNDYSYSLLPLTHVCRHWREVAIGDPRLWCKPTHSNPALVAEMIKRNKGTGLYFDIISNRNSMFKGALPRKGKHWNKALRVQFHNLERAVSIKLDVNPWTMKSWQLTNLRKPAPLLESLHIYDAEFLQSDADMAKLFQGHAPRLRRLVLHKCGMLCTPSLFQNLRSLNMEMTSGTCSRLLTLLHSVPLLERLTIHRLELTYSQGEMLGVVRHRPEVIHLPHLRKLSILESSLDACVHMITHLRASQPVCVALEKVVHDVRTDHLPLAVQAIDSLITANSAMLPSCASVHVNFNVSLSMWDDSRTLHSMLDILPGLRLHSSKTWYRHLSLSNLRGLRITLSNDSWCLTDIPEMLAPMGQVETLHLYNGFAMKMIPLLATEQRRQLSGHPGLFPKLTCLKTSEKLDDVPEREKILENLLDYVRERYEAGAPIRQLGVHAAAFPGMDIEAMFRDFVPRLIIL